MATKLPPGTWIRFALLAPFFLALPMASSFGQGDEPGYSGAGSNEGKGLVSAIQRFFGPRENPPPAPARPSASSSSERPRGPGLFQGGIVRQLRGTANPPSEPSVSAERQRSNVEEEPILSIPTPPSQLAQRPPQEPFAKATVSDNRGPAPTARQNLSPRGSSAQEVPMPRDIFAEDPPSLVGTGVGNGQASSGRSNRSSAGTGSQPSSSPLPVVTRPSSPSVSSLNDRDAEEAPRVSRKSVPATAKTNANGSLTPNGYGIPGNTYLAPAPTGTPPSRNEPPTAVVNSPRPLPSNGGSSSSTSAVKPRVDEGNLTHSQTPSSSSSATASSAGPRPTSGSSSTSNTHATADQRLGMKIPQVQMFVTGPAALQVGKGIPYEVTIRNDGSEPLSGVLVNMMIPPSVKASMPVATSGEFESEKDPSGADSLLWHVSDLAPSQAKVFRITLEATKAEHFGFDIEWTVMPQTGRVEVDVRQPQLNLALEGPSEVLWGKPEVYRLRVRNPGNAEVKDVDVRLSAEAYGSNQTKIGNIPAGDERIIEVELTFQQAGTIKIEGNATSTIDGIESSAQVEVAVNQVALAANWLAPAEQYQGSIAEYQLELKNTSRIRAENLLCTTIVPSGLKVVTLPPEAKLVGNELKLAVPALEPGANTTFLVTFQATESGAAKLISDVSCSGGGKAATESLVMIESLSDLKLTVTDPVAPAPVGQDVTYDLNTVNRGSKAANAVKLIAQFSNGIEPVRAEGSAARVLPGQVVFDPIPVIEPGQEITLRVVAQAAEAGVHRFRAELQCEDAETQLVEEETTRYLATSRTEATKPTLRR